MLAVVPGARSIKNAEAIVEEAKQRVDDDVPLLLTSDEYPAYETAIEHTFGEPTPESGGPGRPRILSERAVPEHVVYAPVHKQRQGNRIISVTEKFILRTMIALKATLSRSKVSSRVNTSFLERQNGADRGCNVRKDRKSSRFSKD